MLIHEVYLLISFREFAEGCFSPALCNLVAKYLCRVNVNDSVAKDARMVRSPIGIIYENAMCSRHEQIGKCEAVKLLSEAISSLAGLPSDSAVIKDGEEIVVSVGEALMHLRNRLSAVDQVK